MTCLAQSKAGSLTCHYDNDWGFKICYDNNGCLLGANTDDMVLIESPTLMNDVLDGDIMGSFCPATSA
eukprot:CAMPEP_0179448386 /NCGR_PEP_ID=MMETSP0799-20121207/32227_1 /TAXON_ID=46947 /ORGANISM="Geminigera cryophila, Strain CCMP2564" /LENGTH=67 /DNA_ID=CAMNT_0021240167 /DNA_START=102 /DNA_END=305 /DNA_ORIENTATION=+